jgi:YidC/Oxa1 family membrane protein insertase
VIAVVWFQAILNGLGWVLARLYDFIPNYGVSIIILTLAIRLLLLPLGVKQIRSMQATAALQPKIKQLQQKYKGDRQAMNQEMMKLYQEHGYNPLSGCFPLLAQLPVLIALFAVLQFPKGITHVPPQSALHAAIQEQHTHFVGANLLCSAIESGRPSQPVKVPVAAGQKPQTITKDCGHGIPVRIPYYLLSVLMVGATYYQQRQMQKITPAGTNPQQQRMMRVMPLLFGFYGFIFPAGLVIYWTTTTLIQIGQQRVLLSRQPALPTPASKKDTSSRADGARKARPGRTTPVRKRPGSAASGGASRGARGRPASGGQRSSGGKGSSTGGRAPRSGGQRSEGGSGGRDAGDRKKRPKR